jgi:hypothetical protein
LWGAKGALHIASSGGVEDVGMTVLSEQIENGTEALLQFQVAFGCGEWDNPEEMNRISGQH